MSNFYTRTGDDGFTGLLGELRVPKHHPIPQTIGALDEANAALGVARAFAKLTATQDYILACQRDLYWIMAEVAATPENASRFRKVDAGRIAWLEQIIDEFSAQVQMPQEFIVPGDSQAGGLLALARTIIRRAERLVSELAHSHQIENTALLGYINRLSSVCFVLELAENNAAGSSSPTLAKEA